MPQVQYYYLRPAWPNESGSVASFYDSPERPDTVGLRTRPVIDAAINERRFFVLVDQTGRMSVGAAIYVLPYNFELGKSQATGRSLSYSGKFGEIGSLLAVGERPSGVVTDLMYAVSCLQVLMHAEEWRVNILTTQVVADIPASTERLQRLVMPWTEFKPNNIYRTAVRRSLADSKSKATKLRAFTTPVGAAVFGAASILLGNDVQMQSRVVRSPFWREDGAPNIIFTYGRHSANDNTQSSDRPIIKIDLSHMPELLPFAQNIVNNGKSVLSVPDTVPWGEARGHIIHCRPLSDGTVGQEPVRRDRRGAVAHLLPTPAY